LWEFDKWELEFDKWELGRVLQNAAPYGNFRNCTDSVTAFGPKVKIG
jgi:hypothetical protein